MIFIEEKLTSKLPGETSLYLSFDYNNKIVDTLKLEVDTAFYDSKNKVWEVPCSSLSRLVDTLLSFDDIKLKILPDKKEKEEVKYKLKKYKVTPFKHQEEAIQFGLNHNKWLLLDAPGLGKTASMIHLAEELKDRNHIKHCLIICGVNSLKTNWKNEIEKHSKLDCLILGQRFNKKGELKIGSVKDRIEDLKNPIKEFFVITNIETLRNDDIIKFIRKGKNEFDMIVVDECQHCKTPTAEQSKNLLKLKNANYKIGLTGTILTNSPMDAYVPLKFIEAERSTFSNFKYYYCVYGGPFNNLLVGYKHMDELKDQLERYSLRRTADLLDLPPFTIINEYVDMEESQKTFYNNIKEGIIEQVDKVHMSNANVLAMTARLRQATACPAILTTENIESAKIERAVDLIEQIVSSGNKVLVFSTFKDTLSKLKDRLSSYPVLVCTGDTKSNDIDINKKLFQEDPQHQIMLATHQKMGTGHTLNAAIYCIFIDVPWTSADFEQAWKRIHRIGSNKPVFIYHLITKGTIDERVLEIVNDKEAISDYIVDDKITQKGVDSLKKYIQELQ